MIKLEHYYLALLHLTSFLLNSKFENHTLEREKGLVLERGRGRIVHFGSKFVNLEATLKI